MEIREIKREKGHLVKLCLLDGESVLLDSDYVANVPLKKGDILDEESLQKHIEESEYIRAKSRALWFLDRADHSERALFEKIVKGGISKKSAARAINRLKELKLIDDRSYALRLSEKMSNSNISRREAYVKLITKGVPKEIANEALSETLFDEEAQIKELIERKYAHRISQENGAQKVYAALVRKGFSYAAVKKALKSVTEELEYSDV